MGPTFHHVDDLIKTILAWFYHFGSDDAMMMIVILLRTMHDFLLGSGN